MIRHGSLFSGIGGFDLAAEWMGWENVFHCEWNDFGKKILNYYWPNAISYDDITKTDFTIHRGKIDILTGGFPCQPYSMAGKRKGKEDERHLWPEMLRAIREIKPRYVVGENVSGLLNWNGGLVFNEVQIDLENEGYKVQPCVLPACAVNAPHRRDRVWFVAYANERTTGPSRKSGETESNWSKNNDEQSSGRKQTKQHSGCSDVYGNDTDTNSTGLQKKRTEQQTARIEQHGELDGITTNTDSSMRERREKRNEPQEGCEPNEKQFRRYNKLFRKNFEKFPSKPPICGGNDGISRELDGITFPKWRNESIKAYGNAIVPQVAHQIFKALNIK